MSLRFPAPAPVALRPPPAPGATAAARARQAQVSRVAPRHRRAWPIGMYRRWTLQSLDTRQLASSCFLFLGTDFYVLLNFFKMRKRQSHGPKSRLYNPELTEVSSPTPDATRSLWCPLRTQSRGPSGRPHPQGVAFSDTRMTWGGRTELGAGNQQPHWSARTRCSRGSCRRLHGASAGLEGTWTEDPKRPPEPEPVWTL